MKYLRLRIKPEWMISVNKCDDFHMLSRIALYATNNPAEYEVLIKQYLHSILDGPGLNAGIV